MAKKEEGGKKRMPRALRIILSIIGGIVGVLVLAVAVLLVVPMTENGDRTQVKGSADWMAQLPDDVLVGDIIIPGTHDSATKYCELAFITKCQALSISEQLEAGYRYLDIRLGDDGEGTLELYHGFTHAKTGWLGGNLTLEAVLADCTAFLAAHPTETVIFCVKQEHGDVSVAEFQRLLDVQIAADEGAWLLTDTVPTLGEARGKLVLLRRYEDDAQLGARAGLPVLWPDQGGHDNVSLNVEKTDQAAGYAVWVQDRFEYGAEDKWTAFIFGMETAADRARSADIRIHFLSTKGTFVQGHPYGLAKKLNPELAATDTAGLSGWIIVDFASATLAEHIYSANF